MIKPPDRADVQAAELKVVEAKGRTVAGGRRTWLAMKSALARPSSLGLVAAAGFCGGLIVSRPRTLKAASAADRGKAASFAGLALAFATRYAARILPQVIAGVRAGRKSDVSTQPCTVVQTTVIHGAQPSSTGPGGG